MPKVVCMSDIHSWDTGFTVPEGDVLVAAGDLTSNGGASEVLRFVKWMGALPHAHKIIVAGNHDWLFQTEPALAKNMCLEEGITYLQDSGTEVEGLQFWGSPWQPWFYDWAFNVKGPSIKKYWDLIPDGTDVLITHGPPFKILDRTSDGRNVGCPELAEAVDRVKPKLHVFGHIHPGYGRTKKGGTIFVNAAVCNDRYRPVNPIQVVEL